MVVVKAIDEEKSANQFDSKKQTRLRLFFIRAGFLIAWLTFSLLIFLIAVLADLNWMRPNLEQVIGQSVHRNVKLGRLAWNFGWHGFAINSSRLLVAERTGDPFLMAGNCEIGFSLWPLMIGIGKINYVDIQKPLFMAVHTGPKSWNFDDMLVASPDIDSIQIHGGHIFVVDRPGDPSQRSFADTELNDVQIKLERAGNFKPAQVSLAFTLAKQKTKAAYNFEAKIWGDESKPWWERKCHFDLATKRFTAQNWQTITSLASVDSKNPAYSNFVSKLTSTLPKFVSSSVNASQVFIPTSGEFDFHAIASGIPSQKTDADL